MAAWIPPRGIERRRHGAAPTASASGRRQSTRTLSQSMRRFPAGAQGRWTPHARAASPRERDGVGPARVPGRRMMRSDGPETDSALPPQVQCQRHCCIPATASKQPDCRYETPPHSPSSCSAICRCRLPLPVRRHRARRPLVPALRPVRPRCRGAARRAWVSRSTTSRSTGGSSGRRAWSPAGELG
jgi:hypothetical protein